MEDRAVYLGLLVSLVALLLLPSLLPDNAFGAAVVRILFSLVLLVAVVTSRRHRRTVWIAIALWIPAVGLRWAPELPGGALPSIVGYVSSLLLIGLVATTLLSSVLTSRRVTQNTLYGAVCVYLLLGVAWALLYSLVELEAPGSFVLQGGLLPRGEAGGAYTESLLYFSLVTLTTLGYGDVTPVTELAQMLAVIEAMTGQLYVAITVAGLVALQVTHSREP